MRSVGFVGSRNVASELSSIVERLQTNLAGVSLLIASKEA